MRTSAETMQQPGPGKRRADRGLPGSIPLGHWHGVEVDAHWTLCVTVGLFTVVLATGTLPQAHPGDPRAAYWLVAIGTALALFFSLLAHELAHAVVARGFGVDPQQIVEAAHTFGRASWRCWWVPRVWWGRPSSGSPR